MKKNSINILPAGSVPFRENKILYEDRHLIFVNKYCGEIVQADATGDVSLEQSVKRYIKEKYNKENEAFLGVTHRIDRPVSGVVMFARTSKALVRINRMFQQKEIRKTYLAIVKNLPPKESDTLIHYIERNPKKNKSYAYAEKRPDAQPAILHYRHIASSDRYHLLEIDLETGRHHQIRCQLATIGCPVHGDLKYGCPRSNPDGGIHLHARQISLLHPVKNETIRITAPLPRDVLWEAFRTGLPDDSPAFRDSD
ncbi:MAG: RluA family pseudouridine synthase [Bacteroidales bacterium]|jgi:23S rRNA pseudouridine1911/1915/1917 synthase|nr:RluA family pseudouridine synthase [Bacteroidales bacterium]